MLIQLKIYLLSSLYFLGIMFMIMYPPRNFESSNSRSRDLHPIGSTLLYPRYLDYDEVVEIATKKARDYKFLASVVKLQPQTTENRSLIALELHSDFIKSKKPGILIVGALDAMAWGVPNTIMELAERLLHGGSYQSPYFNDYDWYLVPVGNPDGLMFTQNIRNQAVINESDYSQNVTSRYKSRPDVWHKNVQPQDIGHCFGVNINRNFPYHWQDDAKKPNRCCQFYPGQKPFTTPESRALRSYVDKLDTTIQLAIHLSASFIPKKDLLMYPWRYTRRPPSNQKQLQQIGESAARQSRLADGRIYEVHQSSHERAVAGSLSDYISGVVGTDLVFILKPFHQTFPHYNDTAVLESFVNRSTNAILSLVRAWRKTDKKNTLNFFGFEVDF